MVVLKRIHPALILPAIFLIFFSGCGKENPDKVLDRALTELVTYSKARTVADADATVVEVPGSRAGEIKQITRQQQEQYTKAVEDLRTLADLPVDTSRQARDGARAKTLLSAVLAYEANWAVDDLRLFDSQVLGLRERTGQILLNLEQLKSEKATVRPDTYTAAIDQSRQEIENLNVSRKKAAGGLNEVTAATKKLQSILDGATKRRDALTAKVGELTDKVPTISAAEAVKIQKAIGDLERERFAVLIEMEMLAAGPMELPAELAVNVNDKPLKRIGGIKQLNQEKALLETQIKGYDESIAAQDAYRASLEQQVKIANEKGKLLTDRLEKLTATLKATLKQLDAQVDRREQLANKAQLEAQTAVKYARQAGGDLGRYIAAVGQARGKLPPGRDDAVIQGAEAVETMEFTIGNYTMNSQLSDARVKAGTIRFVQTLAPILKRCKAFTDLPPNLAKWLDAAPAAEKDLSTKLVDTLDQSIKQYETVNNKAARGTFKTVVGTSLALALSEASTLIPAKANDYRLKVKDVLDKVAPGTGTPDSDPAVIPARQLRQELGF